MPRDMLTSGQRDRRITLIRQNATGTDEFGNPTYGAPETFTFWAGYMPVSDGERVASAEVMANLTARFSILWSAAVATLDPTWTLLFEGSVFDILGVKEIGRRRGFEISAAVRGELTEAVAASLNFSKAGAGQYLPFLII